MAQKSYAEAKKANPNLDKLIKERKGYEKGSTDYNKVQNQINKAYGVAKMRPEAAKMAPKPKAKPAPKPTLKGSTTPKPVAAVKKTKASIRETAQNRRKGARYEKRDAMKELRGSKKTPKDRTVAQGADRADRRAERKQDRAKNKAKRQGARAVKKAGRKVTRMVGRAASTLENKLKGLS